MLLSSFGKPVNAVVVGASGGIGSALCRTLLSTDRVNSLYALSRVPQDFGDDRVHPVSVDVLDEASIASAARAASGTQIDLAIVATGLLHRDTVQPEKSARELAAANLLAVYSANVIGPMLVAKHFLPTLATQRRSVFAALSARVGSIADNRLGGWYAYRSAKAALNMAIKTLSIEHARRAPDSVVVALHPGTVATNLSQPFVSRRTSQNVFEPEGAAERLLSVIDGLTPESAGGFFAWDGKPIPW